VAFATLIVPVESFLFDNGSVQSN